MERDGFTIGDMCRKLFVLANVKWNATGDNSFIALPSIRFP